MNARKQFAQVSLTWAAMAMLLVASTASAHGLLMPGVGPVNRSMGGAATAAPLDAAGALRWNPATMSGLAGNQATFGVELLLQEERLSSTVPTLGGPISGSTEADAGTSVIPEAAIVHKLDGTPWTVGVGVFGIAGFKTNFPSSLTNPVLMPQPNGLGRVFAELEICEIAPAFSRTITPSLSIGFGPTLALARLNAAPLFLATPDDANGDTAFTYPAGLGTRYHYGGAFQAGVYYIAGPSLRLGASVKSPTWFEDFGFLTTDENGAPRFESVDMDLPLTLSFGTAFAPSERFIWATDFRYLDYENTDGFRSVGYDATGAGTGLGWSSVFALSSGVQVRPYDCLALRFGYTFQQNPISDNDAFFNVASPLVISHIASIGASVDLTQKVTVNLAYLHGFEGESSGPIQLPGVGAVPGSNVTSNVYADAFSAGVTVRY